MTGLAGLTPSFTQSDLIDSIAKEGSVFITVPLTSLRSPNYPHLLPTTPQRSSDT